MGNSKHDKWKKQQLNIIDEMTKVARSVGKSIAQLAPWTEFEMAADISELPDDQIFLNSRYQVNVRTRKAPPPFGAYAELSIKTRDKVAYHDWRDFQRIKNELIGPEFEAVELYPAESRLVDTSNQYFLFCFRRFKFPFGFDERLVSETEFNGSRQRPFENKPADLADPEDFKKLIEEEFKRRGLELEVIRGKEAKAT